MLTVWGANLDSVTANSWSFELTAQGANHAQQYAHSSHGSTIRGGHIQLTQGTYIDHLLLVIGGIALQGTTGSLLHKATAFKMRHS